MIESERKKRMELNEIVNVLAAELERKMLQKVEARNLRKEADRLTGKVEEARQEVSVRPKNRAEGGKNGNGIEQVRLNSVS